MGIIPCDSTVHTVIQSKPYKYRRRLEYYTLLGMIDRLRYRLCLAACGCTYYHSSIWIEGVASAWSLPVKGGAAESAPQIDRKILYIGAAKLFCISARSDLRHSSNPP
jgi:hypothetical protein